MRPVWRPLPEGLLEDVKNYLDITWKDDATDKKVEEYVRSGMKYLNDRAGYCIDYSWPGDGRTLLMDYARYVRDGALDVFENNYRHILLALRNNRRIEQNETESVPSWE